VISYLPLTESGNFGLEMARKDASLAVRQSALMAAARLKPDKGLDLVKPFLSEPVMRAAEERDLLWKGRKNTFGAVGRVSPTYYV
jgi:hypothetical protein